MLVLSRIAGEWLDFYRNGEVVMSIRINNVRGNKVSLGIEAPDDYRIMRREIKEKPERKLSDDRK